MSATLYSRVISHRRTGWATASGIMLGLYALLFVFLVFAIYGEDKTVNVPLVVLATAGLILSAALLVTRRAPLCWVAAALTAIDLLADAPFQIRDIVSPSHPNDAARAVVSAIILLVGVSAFVVAVLGAARSTRA